MDATAPSSPWVAVDGTSPLRGGLLTPDDVGAVRALVERMLQVRVSRARIHHPRVFIAG
jgi:hypothetical protein